MHTYIFTPDKELIEHKLEIKVSDEYTVVGHGGKFLVLESEDRTELRLY